MYHAQQQVALTSLRGHHSRQFKEYSREAVKNTPGHHTPSETPREGIQTDRPEDLMTALESLRCDNSVLREQLALAQDKTRARQVEMISKLEDDLQESSNLVGGGRKRTGAMAMFEAQNKLLKEQMKNLLKDAEAQERRIASLESYNRTLETQNMKLISRTTSGSTRGQSQQRQTPRGEPDLSIPGLEKYDRHGSGGNKLLNEVQGRPNTREFRKIDGHGVSERKLQETSEKLEAKMNIVLESVEALTHRVASFQSNPPFEVTSPGGAALRKMNKSVDKMGAATDDVSKVAAKLAKLESTIAKLASSNVLTMMVKNSTQQATSIFEISDALQNMEGKFDLLVKNVVHKVENVAGLIKERHQPGEETGEVVETKIVDTPDIVANIDSFKAELGRLVVGMNNIDRKLERTMNGKEQMGLDLEKSRGEAYTSLLTSDVSDLRKDLNSLRGEITRTTVTPIKFAVESLLDRIAAISTYMVELKLQAFERCHDMPIRPVRFSTFRRRSASCTTPRGLPKASEIDDVEISGNPTDRCATM
jgi:hypothetical protein